MVKVAYFGSVYRGHNVTPIYFLNRLSKEGFEFTYYMPKKYAELAYQMHANVKYYPESKDSDLRKLVEAKLPSDGSVASRLTFLTETTVDASKELLSWVMDELTHEDFALVLYDNMALWGYFAAQRLGTPNACSNILMALNSKVMKEAGVGKIYLDPIPKIDDILSNVTYPGARIANFADIMTCEYNPNKILHASKYFQHYVNYFPDNEYVFFSDRCAKQNVPMKVLKENPTIFVSFGTIYNNNVNIFIDIINGISHPNNKIIISTGGNKAAYNQLITHYGADKNIEVELFLDQEQILSEVDIFITHAGMNSVSESICNLVPMITIPMVGDQHYISARLNLLNAGYRVNSSEIVDNIDIAIIDIMQRWSTYQENLVKIRDSFNNDIELQGVISKLGELGEISEPNLRSE